MNQNIIVLILSLLITLSLVIPFREWKKRTNRNGTTEFSIIPSQGFGLYVIDTDQIKLLSEKAKERENTIEVKWLNEDTDEWESKLLYPVEGKCNFVLKFIFCIKIFYFSIIFMPIVTIRLRLGNIQRSPRHCPCPVRTAR